MHLVPCPTTGREPCSTFVIFTLCYFREEHCIEFIGARCGAIRSILHFQRHSVPPFCTKKNSMQNSEIQRGLAHFDSINNSGATNREN